MPDWREVVLKLLDDAERGVNPGLTRTDAAAAAGVHRSTLYRDTEIREKFENLKGNKSESGVARRTAAQRIRALDQEIKVLKQDKARLIQSLVIIYRRLLDRGHDPVLFMGKLTPNRESSAWSDAVLPWEDR